MLKVELRSLDKGDVVLDKKGLPEALGIELNPELIHEPLETHCEVTQSGESILVKGWVAGRMFLPCDRCLKKFERDFKSFFEVHYSHRDDSQAPDEEEELAPEDMETVFFDGETLDLGDQVRQTVLLTVPMRVLCKEECRGLCPRCGCDRNQESCECTDLPGDSRWESLKKWKSH
jgi:uncharacterized protein